MLENQLKSVFFHQNKLKEKNIILDNNKVQRLIQEIPNQLNPKEEEILRNMNELTIDLNKNVRD